MMKAGGNAFTPCSGTRQGDLQVGCSVWYPPVVALALTVRYRDNGDRGSGSKEGSWGRCTAPESGSGSLINKT